MSSDFMENYDVVSDVEKRFPIVWKELLAGKSITPQEQPVGIILGGQPGAGKSFGSNRISNRLNKDVLVINGDEFRAYHSYFHEIGKVYGEERLAEITQPFSNAMIQKVKDEAFKNHFNVVIEGTFRTTATPLNEIVNLKNLGYQTGIVICTCPKEDSWASTIKRGHSEKRLGLPPRYVPKEHHDNVVRNLSSNVEIVFKEARPDFLKIYSRRQKLFDSRVDSIDKIKSCIDNELNRNTK